MPSLVLSDNHPLVLHGMQQLLSREPDFQVLALCADGEEALAAVKRHQPDVLVLNLRMPRKDGIAVLRELGSEHRSTSVVLQTAVLSEDEMLEAMRLGVKGIVLKEIPPSLLVRCIRKVHAGGTWLENTSVRQALYRMLRAESATRELSQMLTPREVEIVRLVITGLRNGEIAARVCVSEATVKTHLHHIYEKLSVRGRFELLLYARERGL
jgi:DNA-binding NarL/FixJ family response regulator